MNDSRLIGDTDGVALAGFLMPVSKRTEPRPLQEPEPVEFWKSLLYDLTAIRAHLSLLLCDCGDEGPSWPTARIAEALGITARTIENTKRRMAEGGLNIALERKKRETPPIKSNPYGV